MSMVMRMLGEATMFPPQVLALRLSLLGKTDVTLDDFLEANATRSWADAKQRDWALFFSYDRMCRLYPETKAFLDIMEYYMPNAQVPMEVTPLTTDSMLPMYAACR